MSTSTIFRQVQRAVPQKSTQKPGTCAKNPFFRTILTHRERCWQAMPGGKIPEVKKAKKRQEFWRFYI
jgi:hypothetical protein